MSHLTYRHESLSSSSENFGNHDSGIFFFNFQLDAQEGFDNEEISDDGTDGIGNPEISFPGEDVQMVGPNPPKPPLNIPRKDQSEPSSKTISPFTLRSLPPPTYLHTLHSFRPPDADMSTDSDYLSFEPDQIIQLHTLRPSG